MDPGMNQLLKWSIENSEAARNDPSAATDPKAERPSGRPLNQAAINSLFGGPSDSELMKQAMAVIESPDASLDNKLIAFDNFEQLIEIIDNANNMESLGLWSPLVGQLESKEPDLRRMAAWCLGTAVQNNVRAQERLLAMGSIPLIIKLALDDASELVRRKAIYAISSAIRNYQPACDIVAKALPNENGPTKVDAGDMDAVDQLLNKLRDRPAGPSSPMERLGVPQPGPTKSPDIKPWVPVGYIRQIMAPTKTVKSKFSNNNRGQARNLKNLPATKAVPKTSKVKRPKLQKTPSALGPVQKKKKTYTDKELGLPKLNMITPAGVDSPKGKKKGKVFVDDQESMMTILAIVEATREGQIESKLKKSRHLEEIREARRKELEAKQGQKNSKLEQTKESLKESLRRKRKRKNSISSAPAPKDLRTTNGISTTPGSSKKRVSFI